MNITNKTFRNNRTGETIRVIDSFEDIAILENKQKVNVKSLMDPNQYTEQIDPSTFFNNQKTYDVLVEKIKNISTGTISPVLANTDKNDFNPSTQESAIIQTSVEDEMAELARKYGAEFNNKKELENQNNIFEKILNPESETLVVEEFKDDYNKNQDFIIENNIKDISNPISTERIVAQRTEDPIISMFRNTKRNVDFSISIEVENRIPRIDFIEMLEDSYNTSIIEFLSDEFTNKILENPSFIKEKIKSEITNLVYGNKTTKTTKNKKPSAKERIKLIYKMNSIKEIEKAIKTEKAKTVIEAGNTRIYQLKNKQ